jgi:transposase
MSTEDCGTIAQAPVQTTLAAIFFSMELSRSTWLITSLSPGDGEKMLKRTLPAGDLAGLLSLLDRLREKAGARTGESYLL